MGADMWFEAFAAPWIAEVLPQVLTAEKTTIWRVGYLSSNLLFAIGWVLFGLASLRAGVFSGLISSAIMAGGAIGLLAAKPPYGVALGLALASLGMIRTGSAAETPSQPTTV